VKLVRELIRAWDPIAGKIVWEHETSSGMRSYDGGVMSTAGNLVFQAAARWLWIYAGDTGKVLRIIETGSHIMAAPPPTRQRRAIRRRAGGYAARHRRSPVPPQSATISTGT